MIASSRFADRGRVFVTTSLLGSFVFALFLGSSPQLHARVHGDAAQREHICAVTLIASGKFDHVSSPPVVSEPCLAVEFPSRFVLTPIWVESPFLVARIFEHAPPGCF